jgi:hypothetical protein
MVVLVLLVVVVVVVVLGGEGVVGQKRDRKCKARKSADAMRNNPVLLQQACRQKQHYSAQIRPTVRFSPRFAIRIRPVTTHLTVPRRPIFLFSIIAFN